MSQGARCSVWLAQPALDPQENQSGQNSPLLTINMLQVVEAGEGGLPPPRGSSIILMGRR